ncbi:MAG: hypothetical protein MH204_10800, partial [Fimbriimonadaceae bacterium]|nr:hypothetical protein [Fimbriimonadaceae bacterium]
IVSEGLPWEEDLRRMMEKTSIAGERVIHADPAHALNLLDPASRNGSGLSILPSLILLFPGGDLSAARHLIHLAALPDNRGPIPVVLIGERDSEMDELHGLGAASLIQMPKPREDRQALLEDTLTYWFTIDAAASRLG